MRFSFGMMAALLLVGVVTAAGAVSASLGMFRNGAADEAMENNDYAGWKSAMENSLTEERFQEMVTRHEQRGRGMTEEGREAREAFREAMQSGDYEAYSAAAETLGIEKVLTSEEYDVITSFHETLSGDVMRSHGALRQAVLDADYDAYVDAAETLGASSILTEDEFNTLVEIHGSMKIGFGNGMGKGRGMGEGRAFSGRMMSAE